MSISNVCKISQQQLAYFFYLVVKHDFNIVGDKARLQTIMGHLDLHQIEEPLFLLLMRHMSR